MFRRIRIAFAVAGLVLASSASSSAPDNRLPIIDVHVHAFQPDRFGVPGQILCQPYANWAPRDPAKPMEDYLAALSESLNCPQKLKAPLSAEELRTRTFAELDRNNVALAVVSGESADVESWRKQRPNMIIPGLHMGRTGPAKLPSLSELRRLHADGQLEVLGEIAAQNGGMAPNDPALEPYFALAEELDIPVAFHMGLHAPGTAYFASLGFRASNGDPLLFEDVLVRHPKMRIYLCHAAWPLSENLIAMMHAHPQVYVDTSAIDHMIPRAEFHHYLRRLVEAGFIKRIMFGSDQMIWPESISNAVAGIESADFLSNSQRRDIFYNNAVRFFRLENKLRIKGQELQKAD